MRPQFSDLIDNLVVTMDRFIRGPLTASALSSQSSAQGAKPRIAPVPLLWSAALRVNREFFIQASIEFVDFLLNIISFIYLVHRIGRSREYSYPSRSRLILIHTSSFRILAWPVV